MFRCILPPALLAELPWPFTCHCCNTGVERTPNKSQHTKLTLERKILPPLLPAFELTTFRSRVRRSTSKLTRRFKFHWHPYPTFFFILATSLCSDHIPLSPDAAENSKTDFDFSDTLKYTREESVSSFGNDSVVRV